MHNGFLGVVATLLASAGMAWAQVGPGDPLPAPLPGGIGEGYYDPGPQGSTSPNIPPNFTGSNEPFGGIPYPPPMNWEQSDPNGPAGSIRPPTPARFWMDGEYILWWAKPGTTNYPIATTSAAQDAGVIGAGSTSILYNTSNIGYQGISGFRGMAGYFLDEDRRFGAEVGGFFTSQISSVWQANSNSIGTPLLARPYINTATGQQDAVLVANPGASSGYINSTTTLQLWGLEGNAVINFYRSFPGDAWGMDLNAIVGVRYFDMTETMTIGSITNANNQGGNLNITNGQTFIGNYSQAITDQYRVINQFYGGQFGLNAQFRYDRWTIDMAGKVALGETHEILQLAGNTILNTGAGAIVTTGGVLTQSTNIGKYSQDTFAVLPEFSFKIGYRFNAWLSGNIGYNLLYISQVARPGQLIQGQADPRLIPAAPQYGYATNSPSQQFSPQTDFWLMGITLGLNIRF